MSGTDTSADVPGKYDAILDGYGYVLLRTVDTSLPFRTQRADYGRSPTFVERQNVSNSYGDSAQDFFLTARQRDWSQGEQQKYFRSGRDGRYWMGSNADVSVPGQVKLAPTVASLTFASAAKSATRDRSTQNIAVATATTLYSVTQDGTISSLGAHGLGAAPSRWGICNDTNGVYLTTSTAGTVGIRKWDGAAFSTFSAATGDSLAFLNNTIYIYGSNSLVSLTSGGATAAVLFTWKGGDGASAGVAVPKLCPYGGKLLLAFPYAYEAAELWIYDGTGTSRLAVLPENFIVNDIDVLFGVVYLAGSFMKVASSTTTYLRPAILFYDGSIGKLWEANDYNTVAVTSATNHLIGPHPAQGVSNGNLIFTDETTGNIMVYNPALGGVASIGSFTPNTGDSTVFASTGLIQAHVRNLTGGYLLPSSTYPSSGYVISSLIDFESSLLKQFRGVRVDFEAASDGNGGTVDIAYQVDSLTGSWTTLQTGATSGTEYTFSNVSGHAIAIKVTLNKGTSTAGPVLKDVNLKAAPQLQSYRRCEYIFDLSGRTGHAPVRLNDDSSHPLEGITQATNLSATVAATAPFSISDRFGTFTGICEPDRCDIIEIRPEEYIGRISVREV